MAGLKTEIIFIEDASQPSGFRVLGDMSGTSNGPISLYIPNVGEFLNVSLPQKNFAGTVTHKAVIYAQTDIPGKVWDLVTRFIITVDRQAKVEPGVVEQYLM